MLIITLGELLLVAIIGAVYKLLHGAVRVRAVDGSGAEDVAQLYDSLRHRHLFCRPLLRCARRSIRPSRPYCNDSQLPLVVITDFLLSFDEWSESSVLTGDISMPTGFYYHLMHIFIAFVSENR